MRPVGFNDEVRDFDLRWDVRTPTEIPLASHRVKLEAQIGAVRQD